MNLKTTLLAGAAVLFAGQAVAADITSALYAPEQGQFTSDTSYTMARTKQKWTDVDGTFDRWARDAAALAEFVEYGVTDKFSINAGIQNEFDIEGDYNNSHNFDYTIGAKYTDKIGCRGKYQIAAHYDTYNPKDFYGHKGWQWDDVNGGRWRKSVGMDFKYSYDLDNGLSWYGIYGFDSDIDQAHRELDQYVKLGLHKYTGQWALDGAIRYDFNTGGKEIVDTLGNVTSKDTYAWWLDLAADYYVRENIAVGVFGSYLLDDKVIRPLEYGDGDKIKTDYAYEYGAHVKVLF